MDLKTAKRIKYIGNIVLILGLLAVCWQVLFVPFIVTYGLIGILFALGLIILGCILFLLLNAYMIATETLKENKHE